MLWGAVPALIVSVLLIAGLVSSTGRSLGELVGSRMEKFPCSGEINFRVVDAQATVARVLAHYAAQAPALDHTDGVSADFGQWRFNLRSSRRWRTSAGSWSA